MLKREFRGKTREDIEAQFSKWLRANAEWVFNVTRHSIKLLPVPVLPPGFQHRKIETRDAFSMLVEHEDKRASASRPSIQSE